MRVLLVGPSAARVRTRAGLTDAGIDVAGEFLTLSDARQSGITADAVVVTPVAERSSRHEDDRADEYPEALTPREIEVLELLAEGLPNRRIADRLGISDQTVKFHVASIFGKLGAANRTDAVRRAARRGLIAL